MSFFLTPDQALWLLDIVSAENTGSSPQDLRQAYDINERLAALPPFSPERIHAVSTYISFAQTYIEQQKQQHQNNAAGDVTQQQHRVMGAVLAIKRLSCVNTDRKSDAEFRETGCLAVPVETFAQGMISLMAFECSVNDLTAHTQGQAGRALGSCLSPVLKLCVNCISELYLAGIKYNGAKVCFSEGLLVGCY